MCVCTFISDDSFADGFILLAIFLNEKKKLDTIESNNRVDIVNRMCWISQSEQMKIKKTRSRSLSELSVKFP